MAVQVVWVARRGSRQIATGNGPLVVVGSKAGHLWDALCRGDTSVNGEPETKARTLAGSIINISRPSAELVIGVYHQLWRIEKSFRMSKHDLQARPIRHHKRDSIEAHLAVVFAALAVTHEIETRTGWSIKRFVQTAGRYRTIAVRDGDHVLIAEEPRSADLCDALTMIT